MPFYVEGQVAIVTGSGQGFGKEFAKRLLQQGAKVCLSDVNTSVGEATLQEFQQRYGKENVTFCKCNVTEESDWVTLWDHAEANLGRKVGLLVNNAGINPSHGWKTCVDVMLNGVGIGTFLAVERMGTSKGGSGGRIVNIASMAGLSAGLGKLDDVGYTMAKWGVVALTRHFEDSIPTNTYQNEGIKAYAICPWFANTALVKETIDLKSLEKRTKNRVLTVNEVGHAFSESLKLDQNGGVFVVFPDCPVFNLPNSNVPLLGAMILFGLKIANPLGIEPFTVKHLTIGLAVVAIGLYFLFRILCCVLF